MLDWENRALPKKVQHIKIEIIFIEEQLNLKYKYNADGRIKLLFLSYSIN
jgi:hypothetical protein